MLDTSFLWLMLAINLGAQILAWFWQIKTKHTDIADIVWAGMLVVNGLLFFWLSEASWGHRIAILIIPVAWYLRLFFHLVSRYDLSNEDGRYQYLRQHWQHNTQLKFFFFFVGQGLIISLFSFPAWLLSKETASLGLFDVLGFLVVIVSYLGIWLSDKQLANFKKDKNNKGKVCNVGLWRYSRHPNYFFEWTHWFAYPLLAMNSDMLWLLWCYPFIMLIFLLKLTGIPFNEQQNLRSKGSAYREYQKVTNKFFPGPSASKRS